MGSWDWRCQAMETLRHTGRLCLHTHAHRMLRAWMLQPPPSYPHGSRNAGSQSLDPPGKRLKYSFRRNENKPKDTDTGGSPINGPFKSPFSEVQSSQAPCTCSAFPSCLIMNGQGKQTSEESL